MQALFDEQKIREELLLHGVRSTYRRVDRPLLSPEDVEREKVERNKRKVLQFAKLNARYVEPVTLRPLFVRRDVWMATGRAWFTRTMFDNIHKVMSGAGWVTSSPWMEIICTTIRRQKKDERMVWVLWSVLARKYGVWGNESEAEWLADGEPAVVSEERVNGEIHHEKTGTEDEEWKDVAWPSSQARRELNKRMEQ